MFNNSLEKNRYSLRKLSVGLASVLIGISFIETNGQTAKADIVDGGNTVAISTKVEKTAESANTANAVANQESAKETNSAQNYGSDDTAETTANKTEATAAKIQGTKAALDAESDAKANTDTSAANTSNEVAKTANTGTKAAANDVNTSNAKQQNTGNTAQAATGNSLQSDAKVTNEQLQKAAQVAKDTNVETTKDAQTANKDTQTLDVTKNNKPLDSKALTTNLTDANGSTQNDDPSKIDASHFADGIHWTPVGWTSQTAKKAKSSKMGLAWSYKFNEGSVIKDKSFTTQAGDATNIIPTNLSFTIDKNDMKAGNKILVSAIQSVPVQGKQSNDWRYTPNFDSNYFGQVKYNITDSQKNTIGYLSVEHPNTNEIDVYFNPTKTMDNLVNDVSASYTFDPHRRILINQYDSRSKFYSPATEFPVDYNIVTSSTTLTLHMIPKPVDTHPNDIDQPWILSTDSYDHAIVIGKNSTVNQASTTPDNGIPMVIKINPIKGQRPTIDNVHIDRGIYIYNAQGQPINHVTYNFDGGRAKTIQAKDDLNSLDLWNATPDNEVSYSNQSDGSILLCTKFKTANPTKALVKQMAQGSQYANLGDPDHYQQIVDNTVKHTNGWGYMNLAIILNAPDTNQVWQVDDVTPSKVHASLGTKQWKSQFQDSHGSTSDLETYKNVKISYVDDDDKGTVVSPDTMTGRQNIASNYKVNIPKGYYVDNYNNGTGYIWNADHTQIVYTFNTDQSINDKNPIVIHLKHNHSVIKDDKYLKNTSIRTITFDFPKGYSDPETITQTIGWTRTGTYDEVVAAAKGLDEAEKEGKYDDWVFTSDPKVTNVVVTINGKSDAALASKYQSYDQQAYAKDNSDVEFAAIPIPKIPGYKATFTHDSANPAMLLVSFIALPGQNHDNNESKDNHDTTPTDPVQPVNPGDNTKHDSSNVEMPVIPSDHKDTVDIPTEPKVPTVPVDTNTTKDSSDVITMDKPVDAPVNAEMHMTDSSWHIKDDAKVATYTVANSEYELQLPRFAGYTLRLVKRNAARDAISFVYVNPNKTLKYIFNIKLANGKYSLTISKVSEDGIIPLEKVTFSDYKQLIAVIAKAVNK